ncbi:MAG: hypothetical protein EHM55_09245 [Acidobacteria bacterium]|nr:MAG: hypothetical protein EHM55_09245 [Acidobacteriota bacterium]
MARLCLDCHEVHEYERCPACTSEAFAFITRWITLENGAARMPARRNDTPDAVEKIDTYRQILHAKPGSSRARTWLRTGSLLVVAGYMARWGWRIANRQTQERDDQPPTRGT